MLLSTDQRLAVRAVATIESYRASSSGGPPVHRPRRRIAKLAALPFPPNSENIFASAKQIPKERNLSFWCVDFACGDDCWLCDSGDLGNCVVGRE